MEGPQAWATVAVGLRSAWPWPFLVGKGRTPCS